MTACAAKFCNKAISSGGECPHFFSIDCQRAENLSVLAQRHNEGRTDAAKIDDGPAKRIARPISVLIHLIQVVYKILSHEKTPVRVSWSRLIRSCREVRGECVGYRPLRGNIEALTIIDRQDSNAPSQRRIAFSSMASNIGARAPQEALMI